MPEVTITIGGRDYQVACQEGEEQFLHAAARLLDTEAAALAGQAGRLPESRMLLMAGLMLADKSAGMDEQVRAAEEAQRAAEERLAAQEAELSRLREDAARPAPEPEQVEVPVLPEGLAEDLERLAAEAEAVAERVEARGALH
jgi:cell division protein ZapA